MACGMAGQFWQLMIARMTVAIGEAGGMAPSMSMVSDLYPKERRSMAISLFMMGPHIGMILAMALGGWIAQQHGWRATFLFFGIPGLVLATLLWLLVGAAPRRLRLPQPPPARPAPAGPAAGPAGHPGLPAGVPGLRAGRHRRLRLRHLGPSFLMRSHDLPLAQAGLLFGLASGLGAASGAIFGGWYCDRLTRRDPRWQLRLPMIGALLGLPMGFAFLLWPAGNWQLGSLAIPHAMIFAVGFGFFNAWWPPLCYAATSHMMAPNQRASARRCSTSS
jgi:MFS family permease